MQLDFRSKKRKNDCTALNYIEQSLILVFFITRCVSISVFASLVCIAIGIASFVVELKICAITAVIKKYKSIIKKEKKSLIKQYCWEKMN